MRAARVQREKAGAAAPSRVGGGGGGGGGATQASRLPSPRRPVGVQRKQRGRYNYQSESDLEGK